MIEVFLEILRVSVEKQTSLHRMVRVKRVVEASHIDQKAAVMQKASRVNHSFASGTKK